ncbi:MAG: Gx transporter family protein [Lachnospiraceae bacterium]|nr:Gx transporter family protein [Lachnospiraceae bacterium]
MKSSSVQKLTKLSLFAAVALAVYGFESLLPPLLPIPGMKPGLANIVTLLLLQKTNGKNTALVLLVRILLSALLFGQAVSLLYSLAGGTFCLLTELLLGRMLRGRALPLISAFGGLSHNLGQLLIACLLTASIAPLSYLPYLIVAGVLTGLFVGLCSHFLLKALPKSLFPQGGET